LPFLSNAEIIAAAETQLDGHPSEFFVSGLQKLEQRAKKCIELRGEYVEQILSLVAVACFLPGRAKDLSAPSCISRIFTQKSILIINRLFILSSSSKDVCYFVKTEILSHFLSVPVVTSKCFFYYTLDICYVCKKELEDLGLQ
jgi:hypothetical protein